MVLNTTSQTKGSPLSAAQVEAILAATAAPNSIRSEQWYDTHGDPFTIQFPAMIEPTGKHSQLDPYFSLPTLKQPELRDIRMVKAQFQLRTLDEEYPTEAIICSKKAANTLMLLISQCKAVQGKEPLLPEAGEVRQEVVPEFSLEDFETTDLVFSGDILKQKFLGSKGDAEVCETEGT
ncbi:hypothetical protein EV424DRAFT_1539614 [Suillus variegatus]|nr:hypothetical protein EV424DRAFT_1539614 [Suillus variegatus]